MGDILQKAFSKFLFAFLPSNSDTNHAFMYFVPLGEWNPLPGKKFFSFPRRVACAKAFSSHFCELNILTKLDPNFCMVF